VKLRNLPATYLCFNSSRDGYADTYIDLGRPSGKERTVKMGLAGLVSGVVRDPSGQGVAGAVVRFEANWMCGSWLARTDKNGRYRLNLVPAGGSWTSGGGNGRYLVQLVDSRFTMLQGKIQVQAGKETPLDIDAIPGTLIQGRVLEPGTNRPVPGARVVVDAPSGRLDTHSDERGEFTWRSAPGKAEGVFESPPPGTYVDCNDGSHLWQVLAIEGERVRLDIYAPSAVRPLGSVKGKAVLSNGSPAASAIVWSAMETRFDRHDNTGNDLRVTVAGEDGSFEVKDVPLPPGQVVKFYVVTRDYKWGGRSALAASDRDASLTVRLFPAVSINAIVRDSAGNVWPNHTLEVRPVVDGRKFFMPERTVTTNGEGRIKLDGILPGLEYNVVDALYYERTDFTEPYGGFQETVLVLAPPAAGKASDAATQPTAPAGQAESEILKAAGTE
jgi:protocatechuate 3,4-dioxygenase beta subunit